MASGRLGNKGAVERADMGLRATYSLLPLTFRDKDLNCGHNKRVSSSCIQQIFVSTHRVPGILPHAGDPVLHRTDPKEGDAVK